mmetsp:Transcript_52100/g.82698  ORF Transcript_52100/g.82698 Transcript_52100/m.82698 type:complete len:210 (-) Transcript_52100:10-639(-)|eukprot:CAMPEP_0169117822 /NCGR_PEP_ID=MMETSP1015-20121227/30669_1 /TAXON_ID=342587 /ORGANISM="Karlodinium micrum, Strain CCMP2283" /LENGTH=209 /DNA_ID=CAMNT_0009180543 /DNA_START=119 /DNA_END=748 /DNA_ORIENTATION=+
MSNLLNMNFRKAETLVQEITVDGKVRDIVTERRKTQAELQAEAKEEAIRNLPEFRRDRESGGSLAQQLEANKEEAFKEDNEKEKPKNVRSIDEDEVEHYQMLEDRERAAKRQKTADDAQAMAIFEQEKRIMQNHSESSGPDLISKMQQHQREKAADKERSAPTAADRLRGRIVVRSRAEPDVSAPKAPAVSDVAPQTGSLVGYASDSDD